MIRKNVCGHGACHNENCTYRHCHVVYDIRFLKTLCEGKPLLVNQKKVLTVNQLPQNLSALFQYIMDINDAFHQIGVICDKRFDQMNEDDCRYVDALVDIYRGQYHSKDRSDKWIKWHWQGKTLPLFLTTSPENKHEMINWICSGRYQLSGTIEDSEYRLPGIIVYANILENLVPIDIKNGNSP
jgi:hypothetical protein